MSPDDEIHEGALTALSLSRKCDVPTVDFKKGTNTVRIAS